MSDWPPLDFLDNPVVWAILALALICFVQEFNLLLGDRDAQWQRQVRIWLRILPVMLSALPLLGLLGTIIGLLSTFRIMGLPGSPEVQMLLSTGIADALITTQLGLLTAIPGLLLLTMIRRRNRERAQ